MAVTSIEKLKQLSHGQEVELQGWDEEPFVCILKRPSLLGLVENGDIPNPLLHAAYILFNGSNDPKDQINLKEANDLYRIIAKAAMVNPTSCPCDNCLSFSMLVTAIAIPSFIILVMFPCIPLYKVMNLLESLTLLYIVEL